MRQLQEFFTGLLALIVACFVVGLVLAIIMFGGLFLTIAGGMVGLFIIALILGLGIKESLNERSP